MVSLETVRSSNAGLKSLGTGLVAVFVGGTSGIGETTAREFEELKALNPEGQIDFIRSDASLLKEVDKACQEIQSKEDKINLLFLSTGFFSLKTTEGLDKKLNLHFYSRFRFTQNLLPLLTQASQCGSLSRQVSVLAAGEEQEIYLDDSSLKEHYSVRNCRKHATTMNSLAAQHLSETYPGTSFVHMFPGIVDTNIMSRFGMPSWILGPLLFVLTPITTSIGEAGERHLYAATSAAYGPKSEGGDVSGADGVKCSGAYLVGSDNRIVGNEKILKRYREQGIAEKVWEHTQDVFRRVCDEGKKW